jgi:hypothetical protein
MKSYFKILAFVLASTPAAAYASVPCTGLPSGTAVEDTSFEVTLPSGFSAGGPFADTNPIEGGTQVDVCVVNDLDQKDGRIAVLAKRGSSWVNIGRTNGDSDNGTAEHAFGYKGAGYVTGVYKGKLAMWTPQFSGGSVKLMVLGVVGTNQSCGNVLVPEDFQGFAGGDTPVAARWAAENSRTVIRATANNKILGRTNGASDDQGTSQEGCVNIAGRAFVFGRNWGKDTAVTPRFNDGSVKLVDEIVLN